MRKALTIFLFLLIALGGQRVAAQSFHFAPLYNYENADLVKRLKNAKTDTAKLNLLFSLAIHDNVLVESPAYIDTVYLNQLIAVNKQARLFDGRPFETLKLALREGVKSNYKGELALLEMAIRQFDEQDTDMPMLLIEARWIFNVANAQEEKYRFYTKQLSYYLQKGRYNNVAACYHCLAGYYIYKGDFNSAINNYLKAGELFKSFSHLWYTHEFIVVGRSYSEWGNSARGLFYVKKALSLQDSSVTGNDKFGALTALIEIEYQLKHYQASLSYLDQLSSLEKNNFINSYTASQTALDLIGLHRLKEARAELDKIPDSLAESVLARAIQNNGYSADFAFYKYYLAVNDMPKAESYLLQTYNDDKADGDEQLEIVDLKELGRFYGEQKNTAKSWRYTVLYNKLNDSLRSRTDGFNIASYENQQKENEQNQKLTLLRQQQAVQQATIGQRNTIIWVSLIGLAAVIVSLVFIYRQLQINKKNLAELKTTQTQLIQSEKMASLGELTAGIAHEIQNPLNFVNNFSEVNTELLAELKAESEKLKAERDNALESELINDLIENEGKINHHGKRADAIVKGMLQHSQSGAGAKEPTNINTLADECMRLAYHGLRAKDKSFNAELITYFDEALPQVNVIPQDMVRVMVNLFNNALYAVNQKQKTTGEGYKAEVSVSTSVEKGQVVISVKDNGVGIPEHVKEKIMQPFFTTKPTGEGTGLGLSLTYDMVVKGHGGSIQVNSVEGHGSEFIVSFPMS